MCFRSRMSDRCLGYVCEEDNLLVTELYPTLLSALPTYPATWLRLRSKALKYSFGVFVEKEL
jgi:hypothetical protein